MKKRVLSCLLIATILMSCSSMSRREQLERVAKDWCETIRASQVIAVYPLTEDVQPGDVFLVQTPIDEQQNVYEEAGFLPLDNHLARLNPDGYEEFYSHSFLDGKAETAPDLPKNWARDAWENAPAAAFPSYAFSVSESTGFSLAIPISGIPVGLSLLNTQTATGNVTLKDARTIGVDTESLYDQLVKWIGEKEHPERRKLLSNFAPKSGTDATNYLRVVTRVYLLGAIDVQLNDARSFGAGADVGAARPVELFLPETADGIKDTDRAGSENYVRTIQRLNTIPGTGNPRSRIAAPGNLTSTEYEAHEKGQSEEQAAQLKRAEDENKTAQTTAGTARTEATKQKKALDLENAELAKRQANLDEKQKALSGSMTALEEKKKALEEAKAASNPDQATINAAQAAVDAASQDVSAKTDEVAAAKADVEEQEPNVAAAKKDFDEANATLREAEGKASVTQAAIDSFKQLAPGGSFRFTAASNRTVSMSEEFDKPLVVGYLGFDVPIGFNGNLGSPIPTHARLQLGATAAPSALSPTSRVFTNFAVESLFTSLQDSARSGSEEAARLRDDLNSMARFIPNSCPRIVKGKVILKPRKPESDFSDYLKFNKDRELVLKRLRGYADAALPLEVDGESLQAEKLRATADRWQAGEEEIQDYVQAKEQLLLYWASRTN